MQIKKYNEELFRQCGYIQIDFKKKGEREYILPIPGNKNGFPRFHIKEQGETFDLHYDKRRIHGKYMGWLLNIPMKFQNNDKLLLAEKTRIDIVNHSNNLKNMLDIINDKYVQINNFIMKYSRLK